MSENRVSENRAAIWGVCSYLGKQPIQHLLLAAGYIRAHALPNNQGAIVLTGNRCPAGAGLNSGADAHCNSLTDSPYH